MGFPLPSSCLSFFKSGRSPGVGQSGASSIYVGPFGLRWTLHSHQSYLSLTQRVHSAHSSEGLCTRTCGVEWLQSTRGEGTEMATSGLFQKFGLSADEVRQLYQTGGK